MGCFAPRSLFFLFIFVFFWGKSCLGLTCGSLKTHIVEQNDEKRERERELQDKHMRVVRYSSSRAYEAHHRVLLIYSHN